LIGLIVRLFGRGSRIVGRFSVLEEGMGGTCVEDGCVVGWDF
jgi:hypothetical protein